MSSPNNDACNKPLNQMTKKELISEIKTLRDAVREEDIEKAVRLRENHVLSTSLSNSDLKNRKLIDAILNFSEGFKKGNL